MSPNFPALSLAFSFMLTGSLLPLLCIMGPLTVCCGLRQTQHRKWATSLAASCAVNSPQLCGIFQIKKNKTLNPCTVSSPQTPWNLVLICSHSIILPIKRFFVHPSQLPPTESCRPVRSYLAGCLFFPYSSSPLFSLQNIVLLAPIAPHRGPIPWRWCSV